MSGEGSTEQAVLNHLTEAVAHLRAAEAAEGCPVCRQSLHDLAVLAEEERLASVLADHLAHQGLDQFRRKTLELGERIGFFSVMARFMLKFRGVGR